MIIVTVNFYPTKVHQENFLVAFNQLAETTRKEDGCISYEIHPKGDGSSAYFLFERWETKEKLEAHLATDHIARFGKVSKEWLEKESELSFYEATEIQLG
ncbi:MULTISPECIES: putative quinol monooxygenase [unclassified Saccharicrinis]|uniref:putative quinol monooxygenase n=1 Tax=unclassified Saccharicrinis TaxID=2646859 RepID=UPI003D3272EB